ncbi:MAG: alpha/beta hydrolase [Lentisphaeria bacterium]|nr:alpha/beta hydrolase [Lentisphaeria bacterium]
MENSTVQENTKEYFSFEMREFTVDNCPCKLVSPRTPLPGKPWIWKAEFFEAFPKFELAMLEKGFFLAFMSVGNTFGCPVAMDHFEKFYEYMTAQGFSKRPIMLGLSRGGLYIYNYAVRHPENVSCLYADNPVCDFKSWPGGKGKGEGSKKDWEKLFKDYGFASEQEALEYTGNPVDNLEILARHNVKLIHAARTEDTVVPIAENTDIVEKRYRELGGFIKVFRHPGGHHPHGLDDPTPLIDCILENVRYL